MIDRGETVGEETDGYKLNTVSTNYSTEFLSTDHMTLKWTVSKNYSTWYSEYRSYNAHTILTNPYDLYHISTWSKHSRGSLYHP